MEIRPLYTNDTITSDSHTDEPMSELSLQNPPIEDEAEKEESKEEEQESADEIPLARR